MRIHSLHTNLQRITNQDTDVVTLEDKAVDVSIEPPDNLVGIPHQHRLPQRKALIEQMAFHFSGAAIPQPTTPGQHTPTK